jgi:hypothetical protein
MNDFYVYVLLDPRCGPEKHGRYTFPHAPRYVGKGRNTRVGTSATHGGSNAEKQAWIDSLRAEDLKPVVLVKKRDLLQDMSVELERRMIKEIGRVSEGGPLLNRGKGGEGRIRIGQEEVIGYVLLLGSASNTFRLTGKYWNNWSATEHTCSIHGTLNASPWVVRRAIARGQPPCPKCSVVARGPVQSEVKRRLNSRRYQEFASSNFDGRMHKFVGPYVTAITPTAHWCKLHGEFLVSPASVKQKLTEGNTCCAECNKTVRSTRLRIKRKEETK